MCPLVKLRVECPKCYPYGEAAYAYMDANKWERFKAFCYHLIWKR